MADEMPDGLWFVLLKRSDGWHATGPHERNIAVRISERMKGEREIKLAYVAFDSIEDFDG